MSHLPRVRTLYLSALLVLAACAHEPRLVDHSFGFNANWDSPDVYILDYRYGTSDTPGTRNPFEAASKGQSHQQIITTAEMPPGEFLYVKWRVKSTGAVYEDRVDLRSRLPADLRGHRIYFIVKGPQLYVYDIPPENRRRPAGKPPNGPSTYDYLDVVTIYPDQPRP